MSKELESYYLGDIKVIITETELPEKLTVTCQDNSFKMEFKASLYEYQYYKRHMNQKIRNRFAQAHEQEKE